MGQPQTSRDEALLNEFAELAMDLARDLHASAKAEGDPEAKARLAQEFHRIGRGLRQTLALKARLARMAVREAVEAHRRRREAEKQAMEVRKTKLRAAVERLIWTEYEADDAQEASDDLDEHLARIASDDDFLSASVETLVARSPEEMGITPSAHPRTGGDPSRASADNPSDDPGDLTFDASG